MPPHIKAAISVAFCLVAAAAYYFGVAGGWALIALPAVGVVGIWAFPDPKPRGKGTPEDGSPDTGAA